MPRHPSMRLLESLTNPRRRSTESYLSDTLLSFYAPNYSANKCGSRNNRSNCRICPSTDETLDKCIKYKYNSRGNLTNKIEELLKFYEGADLPLNGSSREEILSRSKELFEKEHRSHSKSRNRRYCTKHVKFRSPKSCGQQTDSQEKLYVTSCVQTVCSEIGEQTAVIIGTAASNGMLEERKNCDEIHADAVANKSSKCTQYPEIVESSADMLTETPGSSLSYTTAPSCSAVWRPVTQPDKPSTKPATNAGKRSPNKRLTKPCRRVCNSRCQLLKSNIAKIHKGIDVLPRPYKACGGGNRIYNHPLLDRKPKRRQENGFARRSKLKKCISTTHAQVKPAVRAQILKTNDDSKVYIYANQLIVRCAGDQYGEVLNKISKIQANAVDVQRLESSK